LEADVQAGRAEHLFSNSPQSAKAELQSKMKITLDVSCVSEAAARHSKKQTFPSYKIRLLASGSLGRKAEPDVAINSRKQDANKPAF